MMDEGPSADDRARFSGEFAYCSSCGGEIWDLAEFCPDCGDHLGGHTLSRPPAKAMGRKMFFLIVTIIVLLAFILVTL